jgi:ABC-type uncharacterized transport system YnjBCD permease subunit
MVKQEVQAAFDQAYKSGTDPATLVDKRMAQVRSKSSGFLIFGVPHVLFSLESDWSEADSEFEKDDREGTEQEEEVSEGKA